MMNVSEKLALADLLRPWRKEYCDNWVTAQQAMRYLCTPYYHDILDRLGIKSGDSDGLNSRLDRIRDKLTYNFVVKRDLPYMQPVRWRVLLQDNRVTITDEERTDFIIVQKEEGSKIDPATAEVKHLWGNFFDPYGIGEDREHGYSAMKLSWARSPGSNVWVEFHDLPEETRAALWK